LRERETKISKQKGISLLWFVSLLTLLFAVPFSSAAAYTQTVESYYKTSWGSTTTSLEIKVYISPWGSLGGTPYTTPIDITGLEEGTNYYLKVPLTAEAGGQGVVIYDRWEGDTNVIQGPQPDLEMIDTDGDGALDKAYLVSTLNNPIGGGDKLLKAMYKLQWGPQSEHMLFRTILGPTGQRIAMLNREVDILTDLIRTIDIDALVLGPDGIAGTSDDNKLTSTPAFHMCYFAFNLRKFPFGPVNGSNPGQALRQAIAYLLPKDALIGSLFKYIAVRLDSTVPPSFAAFYNPNVAIYDYNPAQASSTLYSAGYTFDTKNNVWKAPNGTALPTISIMSPLYEVAPTSFTIASRLVQEMNAIKLWAVHEPANFWAMNTKVFQYHDFDMYFSCWDQIGSAPDFLYDFFHSSNDVEWGDNSPGIRNDALDQVLETLKFSLNYNAQVEAAQNAQLELSIMLPYVPVYSRNYFNAHRPEFKSVILSPGYGIDNFWTFTNIRGPRISPIVKPPGYMVQGNETIWTIGDKPESFNPAYAGTVYAWQILGNVFNAYAFDSLIMTNPYDHTDMPWLADSWLVEGPINITAPNGGTIVNGMKITFTLTERTVYWHDGEVFDANDVVFSWEYVRNETIPNFMSFWVNLVDADAPDARTAVLYQNTTGLWLLYDAAIIGILFPPQVWNKVRDDPNTLANEVLLYQPEKHPRPNAAYPWLTEVIGVGPWVFRDTSSDNYYTNIVAFDVRTHEPSSNMPNLHFFKTTGENQEMMLKMFYKMGDVSLNGKVDITDLSRLASKYGKRGTPGWRQEDVVTDGIINILDLATAGKNFGKQREY